MTMMQHQGKRKQFGGYLTRFDLEQHARIEDYLGRKVSALFIHRCGMDMIEGALKGGKSLPPIRRYDTGIRKAPDTPEDMNELPCSCREAKMVGAQFYFTGKPCSQGHIAARNLHKSCVECKRQRSKAHYHNLDASQLEQRRSATKKSYWTHPERITGVRQRKFWSEYEGPKKEVKQLDAVIAIAEQAAKQ
jgi:hypothetical protein